MDDRTIVVDFDGTLVENAWPGIGDWKPGAIEAMYRLHEAGFKLVLFSARLSPVDPFTGDERAIDIVLTERNRVRDMLDKAGLRFMDIWTKSGKPGAVAYIDDRAERYNGRPGSWKRVVERILAREGLDG